ncbi:hypothetical protein NE865_15080 [Phthorimaea operculella]|nr:hypothetical protein NE865_15080 [Phthorimaea operculella]
MFTCFLVILGLHIVNAAPPLKLTIDCGSQESDYPRRSSYRSKSANVPNQVDVDSICTIIHRALPKSVNDGKFILIGESTDQSHASNDIAPVTILPPKGFKQPRIKVPNFKVPRLKPPSTTRKLFAPRVGAPMLFPSLRARQREETSSAERMEVFKKGVHKMLHVVKVLGKIDQYFPCEKGVVKVGSYFQLVTSKIAK